MLGQPVYFLTPDVVGVHMTGAIREGVTATDVALTVTQMLRKAKVVGKFVEFFCPGAAALPLVDRATIANMAPEYGATMGFFRSTPSARIICAPRAAARKPCGTYENYYQAQACGAFPRKVTLFTRRKSNSISAPCGRASPARNGRIALNCRSSKMNSSARSASPSRKMVLA